jgi:hypothetical protein
MTRLPHKGFLGANSKMMLADAIRRLKSVGRKSTCSEFVP